MNPARHLVAGLSLVLAASAPAQTPPDPARPVQIGDRFYCQDRHLGTWFYCERPKAEKLNPVAPPAPQAQTAAEKLDAVTAELRELKARAILEPTPDNVTAYIRFQRTQLDRASLFGDVWQRALWQTPDLDYTLQRPVGSVAKQQWSDARKVERDQALDRLGAAADRRHDVDARDGTPRWHQRRRGPGLPLRH
jgi:conjugal transfer pilus assembly protein TraF